VLANPAYLGGFLFSALQRVAPYCARCGIRVVSTEAQLPHDLVRSQGTRPKYVQHLAGHDSIQLTLDRYSHWMPSMGRNAADGMDEALG
jgi:integrase